MRQEIQDLIDQLVLKIERLEKENRELRQVAGLEMEENPEFWKFRHAYPFTIPVIDMDISTRAVNCLKSMDINTVGELVSFSRSQLMKCRSFGRKSYYEIIVWLTSHKLDLEMWRDPARNYKW